MVTERAGRHLLLYGKGGIGKTTIAINLSHAINQLGERVAVIGCSPKSSLWDFFGLPSKPTLLDLERSGGVKPSNINEISLMTKEGIIFVESGGPEPGIGCGGRGLQVALGRLRDNGNNILGYKEVGYFIYDVIGDVVCGGFAMPMRGGGARDVYIVTSGELLSLYAANNIVTSVAKLGESHSLDVRVGGYIANMRGIANEREILEKFSQITAVPIVAFLPRDVKAFSQAEKARMSVIELLPDSEPAEVFRQLATSIRERPTGPIPRPIDRYEDLFDLFMDYQKALSGYKGLESYHHGQLQVRSSPVNRQKPKRIAIYGTGGIGKSTVSANLSAALSILGEKVYQVGCDPKRDSISTICRELKPAILDEIRRQGRNRMTPEALKELIFEAPDFAGRLFGSECGGPAPGKGCAGYGVDMALEYLEDFKVIEEYGFSLVLYDVLGDTVCGGFATPLKYVDQVYVVTSGESPALVQAMKICQSVDVVSKQGLKVDSMSGLISHRGAVQVGIAGIINNKRGLPYEDAFVEDVFDILGIPVIRHIPRSELVQAAENLGMTVVQAFPGSDQANEYVELAKVIQENERVYSLKRPPLTKSEIQAILNKYC